ncbi:MAG: hypothetical protein H7246_17255 [Phycisphaerae bacterium]|nr:hypothetical protein [Saprospiraceae bacterium]
MKTFRNSLSSLMLGLLLLGAASTLQSCSKFDKVGLDNATNLSTMLTDLMGKAATSKFSANSEAIKKVSDALANAVKHAEGVKKNKEIAASWTTLQSDLVTPFLARWKDKGMLDKDVVKEATAQVTKSLDAIRKAELARK